VDADRYFATEWPAAARRIGWTLARQGVRPCDRDDILQETALRLYRAWATVDAERGVEPFARTIALNVLRDSVRRPVHSAEVLGDVPEQADSGDVVERTTLARIELGRVRRALTLLRPAEQRLLSEAVAAEVAGEAADVVAPAALRMARMRARRQLVAVLRTASGLVGALAALRAARGSRTAVAATGVAAVAVAAVLALLAPAVPHQREVALGPSTDGVADSAAFDTRRAAPSHAAAGTARAVRPAPAAPAARRHHAPAPRPARVDLPVGEVEVLLDVQSEYVHVQVREGSFPACVSTVAGPLDDRVDC
jgi:DNA-directed RNA polymerase specialized sigma24 family protein